MPREAGDVHLIDDRGGERPPQRGVAFPVVGVGIDDHASHRDRGVLAGAARRGAIVCVRHHDGARVGIEEDLRRIEAESARGVEGACRPVRVDLPSAKAGNEGVPVVVGPVSARVESNDAGRLSVGRAIEQQELQPLRAPGIDAKVDAAVDDGGTERKTPASERRSWRSLRRRRAQRCTSLVPPERHEIVHLRPRDHGLNFLQALLQLGLQA